MTILDPRAVPTDEVLKAIHKVTNKNKKQPYIYKKSFSQSLNQKNHKNHFYHVST